MLNLFKKKDDFESVKIHESSKDIHSKLTNPSNWSHSLDSLHNILSHSLRGADRAFASKDYAKALKLYISRLNNGAINVAEDRSYTFLKIGHLLRLMNDDDKAVISYRNALDINSDLDSAISTFSVLVDRFRSNSTFN